MEPALSLVNESPERARPASRGAQLHLRDVRLQDLPAHEESRRADRAMCRYARGDDRAFHALYGSLAPRLLRHCARLVGWHDAEELLQEVFLRMHRARATFVDDGHVLPWAHAIARACAIDRRRAQRCRPERAMESARLEEQLSSTATCPETAYAERALERTVAAELARMSDGLRDAYLLVRWRGMTCAEAAVALGVSREAVKKRVVRAVAELKAAPWAAPWQASSGQHDRGARA